VKGIFGNTDCEANGLPSREEAALLEPYRADIPPETFGPMALPPTTTPPDSLRGNLRKAQQLLKEAGWELRDGALRNAKGEPFTIELLDTTEARSVTTTVAWKRALAKIGIELRYRTVDYALYQERLDNFQFEMTGISFPGTHFPGAEYADLFGSQAADTKGSGNLAGIKNPAVDALIKGITTAENREQFLSACRALDRVMAHEVYMVPAWTSRETRIAYNAWRLERPAAVPPYPPEGVPYMDWPMTVWWARMPPRTAK
jgi:microcin C transport system substrate-binding protein